MGIGHLAVGFAAKRAAPAVPLLVLLLAATFLDVLWSSFILLGVEHARIVPGITAASPLDLYDYPVSHSLVASLLWTGLAAATFLALRRDRAAAALVGACVLSHWLLDVVSHRPDVPVGWHGPYLGLGLWSSVPASIAVEEAMLAAGVLLYLRATRPRNRAGSWGLGALAIALAGLGVAGYLAPPPPGIVQLAVGNLAFLLLLLAAHAVDRQRAAA
jgi:membrane-bound metal-dependent hydrolase YbcI (DUF457 family)